MTSLRSSALNIFLSLIIAIAVGWIMAFMGTPLLWRLEGFSGLEFAGHPSPADVVIMVFILLMKLLFCIGGQSLINRKRATENGAEI